MRLSDLRGRSVAVWGTGREGKAAVNAIAPHEPARLIAVNDGAGYLDDPWDDPRAPLAGGEHAFAALASADVIVRSPGVPSTHPFMAELRGRGIPVTGGSALWMADHAATTVGVTGSKGKSTTSSLISHLLAAVGRPNAYGGNIGVPLLDLPPAPLYVLELSSYQCADLTDSPRVAVVTSLFPEHLDAHGGEREYYRDKLNILAHGPELIVVNATDDRLLTELRTVPGIVPGIVSGTVPGVVSGGVPAAGTSAAPEPGAPAAAAPESGFRSAAAPESRFRVADGTVFDGDTALFPRDALRLKGRHNECNLAVALAVLDGMGVDVIGARAELEAALRSFQGLPHRLTEIEDPSGVVFVDDTLSTSPYATMHAVEAYENRPLTVLVGGTDRGLDYSPLRDFLASRELTVIGMPDSGPRILSELSDLPKITTRMSEDLADAVRIAREVTPPGGAILLSPAAPSYGRFRNFEHRSEAFLEAIHATTP